MALLSTLYPQRATDSLPVPFVSFQGNTNVLYLSALSQAPGQPPVVQQNANPFTLISSPVLDVKDISNSLFRKYIIEVQPVFFNKSKKRIPGGAPLLNSSYLYYHMRTPSPAGDWVPNRTHSIRIDDNSEQRISLAPMLNNHMRSRMIEYRTTTNEMSSVRCIVPVRNKRANLLGYRFPYSSTYSPLYVAFQYKASDGGSKVITGPLSPTVQIANITFPFELDHYASSIHNAPCATFVGADINTFRASFA